MVDTKVKRKGDVLIVEIKGRVGITETPKLKKVLEGLFGENKSMILNMSAIQYIDSSCLGALISIRKELEKNGYGLRLVEINDLVRDVLQLTKLDGFFDVCETEEEAIQQLKG